MSNPHSIDIPFAWIQIKNFDSYYTQVLGGWLYCHTPNWNNLSQDPNVSFVTTMCCFIPDPNYGWNPNADNPPFVWTQILNTNCFRVQVFGGWLLAKVVRKNNNFMNNGSPIIFSSIVYVPDSNFIWNPV